VKNVFIDTNIIVDLLQPRAPFFIAAAELLSKADQKKIKIYCSSISIITAEYLLSKNLNNRQIREVLRKFRLIVKVLTCDEKIIDLGLNSSFKDFEDAVQYYIAVENGMDVIITRNEKDFTSSDIPVMTASEFIKAYRRSN
jgi:predicted nucleic acid-binding protein